ncbi:MAG: carboxypeptidase-like regulatory domain-containing protein [Nannocystaceae bacterium]
MSPRRAPSGSRPVPVEIRAHAFEQFGRPLARARVTIVERPEVDLRTDREGRAVIDAHVGEVLTARLARDRYQSIQASSVVVPDEGLVGADRAITLQVPLGVTFRLLRALLVEPRPGCHHVVTTVTAHGKTLADCPQGEPGAQIHLDAIDRDGEPVGGPPIYFGSLPWVHKTDFGRPLLAAFGLRAPLSTTSLDGGVVIPNVPPGRYRLRASKPGVVFTSAEVEIRRCSPALINVSPPHGPRVIATP